MATCALSCGGKNTANRVVRVNESVPCQNLSQGSLGPSSRAEFIALGDFQRSSPNPYYEEQHALNDGAILAVLPGNSRVLEAIANVATTQWLGFSTLSVGDVDILAWPQYTQCALTAMLPQVFASTGATMGMVDDRHLLVVSGSHLPFVADMFNGVISVVNLPMNRARFRASITPFGSGALVAGGADQATNGNVFESAEVFDPNYGAAPGGFPGKIILLNQPRADHAAVALPSGATLLIGGGDINGAPLSSIEFVNNQGGGSFGDLKQKRTRPTAIRLPDGLILVAGGYGNQGVPLPDLEWIDPSTPQTATSVHVARLCDSDTTEQAFVPLVGGAVLAVTLSPPTASCSNVHILRPRDAGFVIDEAPPFQPVDMNGTPTAKTVRLFQGTDGAPVLWDGDTTTPWFRWDPWNATFVPLAATSDLSAPNAVVSPDRGLAVWLGQDALIHGLRFDQRTPYETGALITAGQVFAHVVPDRLAGIANGVQWSNPILSLASLGRVWVTDTTYGDVTITIGQVGGELATVLLRDETTGATTAVGNVECGVGLPAGTTGFTITRRGTDVSVAGTNGTSVPCTAPSWSATARLSVGLQGPAMGTAQVTGLSVVRPAGP